MGSQPGQGGAEGDLAAGELQPGLAHGRNVARIAADRLGQLGAVEELHQETA
jgi:hypothetical protein